MEQRSILDRITSFTLGTYEFMKFMVMYQLFNVGVGIVFIAFLLALTGFLYIAVFIGCIAFFAVVARVLWVAITAPPIER